MVDCGGLWWTAKQVGFASVSIYLWVVPVGNYWGLDCGRLGFSCWYCFELNYMGLPSHCQPWAIPWGAALPCRLTHTFECMASCDWWIGWLSTYLFKAKSIIVWEGSGLDHVGRPRVLSFEKAQHRRNTGATAGVRA